MDYKEKYEQALEVAQRFYNNSAAITKKGLEDIFPELSESEDERIRKAIVATIHLYYGEPLEDEAKEMIAWLEKQGTSYTKRDVDDAYVEGMAFAKYELKKQSEQKPTDEEMKELLQTEYEKGRADAIAEMQNPAWSEEDEKIINKLIAVVELYYGIGDDLDKQRCLSWLKFLRPQTTWKPSDEQMDALESAIVDSISSIQKHSLESLYNKLKKLF